MFVKQPLHKNTIGAASLAFRLLLNPHASFTRRGYVCVSMVLFVYRWLYLCVGGYISLSKHVFRHLLITWNFLASKLFFLFKVVYAAPLITRKPVGFMQSCSPVRTTCTLPDDVRMMCRRHTDDVQMTSG